MEQTKKILGVYMLNYINFKFIIFLDLCFSYKFHLLILSHNLCAPKILNRILYTLHVLLFIGHPNDKTLKLILKYKFLS